MEEFGAGGTGVIARDSSYNWDDLVARAKAQVNTTLPDRTNEAWHYGDPRKFSTEGLQTTAEAGQAQPASAPGHSQPLTAGEDGRAAALPAALISTDHFAAQHIALSASPQLIHIAKGETAKEQHLHLHAPTGGAVAAPTLIIIAEPFSSAQLYLHFSGGEEQQRNLHSVMLFAQLADGARVGVTRLQNYAARTDALLREYVSVGRDAHYTSNVLQLGGANVRSEAHITLAAPGSSVDLRGAYLATGRQRIDFLTHQNHQAPHATSNLLYKGALLGKARASYQGMITVAPDAQRTDAYQSNRTLVLSGSARADSSPQLEIGANDVRCTHGSTVSNVSETELFYMQSRGIPREVARRMLVAAFIAEVTDQIRCEGVRSEVESYVAGLNS